MPKLEINIGSSPNARDGDTLRVAFAKINENFTEVYDSLSLLTGSQDPDAVVNLNIRGTVFSSEGNILVDGVLGKIALSALPDETPRRYQFIVRFDETGNLSSVESMPAGWDHYISDSILKITTGFSKPPANISYWGFQDNGELRMRFPTPGYQAICKPDTGFELSLFLDATVTGATVGQYAYVNIVY
jgi:hypothetical protein